MAELIRRAGLALAQAKQLRVGVATYDSSRDASSTDQLALLAELRDALAARDQIVLALQPAVDLETSAPTGVEALTRWRHPRRGLLPPGEFIKAVEHSELLAPFTRYVLDLLAGRGRGLVGGRHRPAGLGQRLGPQPARPDVPGPDRRHCCAGTGCPPASWFWRSPSRSR